MQRPTPPTPLRVGIIGAGRIGRVLARALTEAGHLVVAVHARRSGAVDGLQLPVVTELRAATEPADVVLLCVPDDAIAAVAAECAASADDARPRTWVVTSGSVDLALLDPLAARGDAIGRLHPLQSITLESTPDALRDAVAAISAPSEQTAATLRQLALDLGMQPHVLADEHRALWHAAATIAASAPTVTLAAARDLAVATGMDPQQALQAFGRLASTALANALETTPERALTGPVTRGDVGTVEAHVQALRDSSPTTAALHRAITRAAADRARDAGHVDPAQHALLVRAVEHDGGMLQEVSDPAQLAAVLEPHRAAGARIGFVPTMGALHDGHLELMRWARRACDVVVVSCYVNPLQFGAGEDLDRYPRSPEQDARLVASAGVDVLWRPDDAQVHEAFADAVPPISVGPIGDRFEGASRPGHFDGVATVVARLLAAVRPDVLVLGEKDLQQVAVIRRLLGRLGAVVRLQVVPTVREADGLARSSRNAYLSEQERTTAAAVPRALAAAREAFEQGAIDAPTLVGAARRVLEAEPGIEIDYACLVDAETFHPAEVVGRTTALVVAVRVGTTRLIDNVAIATQRTEVPA